MAQADLGKVRLTDAELSEKIIQVNGGIRFGKDAEGKPGYVVNRELDPGWRRSGREWSTSFSGTGTHSSGPPGRGRSQHRQRSCPPGWACGPRRRPKGWAAPGCRYTPPAGPASGPRRTAPGRRW